jgi:hypothetical protein
MSCQAAPAAAANDTAAGEAAKAASRKAWNATAEAAVEAGGNIKLLLVELFFRMEESRRMLYRKTSMFLRLLPRALL